ncbi:MAG TPA: protein translocase subunit SecD [Candidatus Saccharimonadales bacterium]|nr:protein translocase subunit SecD [Candidatus Saccharimonadales bacterium]
MKNPKFWWAFIAFLVAWSLWEMNPPTSRNLIQEFREQADQTKVNTNFTAIVAKAEALERADPAPQKQFGDLLAAIGTNDIRPYFPYLDVHNEEHPTYTLLSMLQRKAAGKIKLGLDLQGGTQFLVSLQTNHLTLVQTNGEKTGAVVTEERKRLVSQASEVLRHRVDSLGVAEPIIQPSGENHILIQLPGLSQADQDTARANILRAAYLEFRMVHPDSAQLFKENIIEPGYEVLTIKRKNPNGTSTLDAYLVQKKLANGLTGKYIKRAFPTRDMMGAPEIDFEFDSVGAEKFAALTTDNVGQEMAIVLDGQLITAPVIKVPIRGGSGSITGGQMDINEAISIANALENPLETPVTIDEMRQVDPTLGKDSISSGVRAAVVGTLLVAIFMAVYYHRCGVIADVAMILNLVILLGVMCSIGTTLTLPGIAGIVLTVGMAVDANVLIYERLREEMGQGKSMRGAISAAYSRAFSTIFDSHTTTLISAVILIYLGTGPVKGFGVTLTIGVALSLFTSLVMTRLIFDFLLSKGWLNHIGMMHIIKNPHWDFMKFAKPAFAASWTIILIGMCYGIFVRGHQVEGVDFAGGDAVTMSFKEKVNVDKLRSALSKVGDTQIQYQKGDKEDMLQVVAPYGKGATVTNALMSSFPAAGFHVIGNETVGPTVGVEIQKSAIIASFLSLFGILIYVAFRYEFSFSVGAVIAVLHDVLMTIGIFFLSGRQLSAPMVAAVLTIIGFSINDTIVIFDRIREDLKLGVRGSFKEVMNTALNQTLSRTIITSGTVFIATMSLYLFGGGVINDFAFTFLVGIITGTYSSIYIASALVLWWHKGERPKSASQVALQESPGAGARVRA